MTVKEYQKRMAEFGINRGALSPEGRFPVDLGSIVAAYRNEAINYRLSSRIKAPFEDLSWMNPPQRGLQGGNRRKEAAVHGA